MLGRVPRNYEGLQPTGKQIKDLLGSVLQQVEKCVQDRPDELIGAWPSMVGEKMASMTQAVSFVEGTFLVKVHNATLYSLLSQHERPRLLKQMQEKFPHLKVKKITFRMG
ncbi:MAG: DUF721 domain-containing protein [Chlamydiae bacterium]|nr:DUF721 domain-containing protein [Chlamydiota bacterium]